MEAQGQGNEENWKKLKLQNEMGDNVQDYGR